MRRGGERPANGRLQHLSTRHILTMYRFDTSIRRIASGPVRQDRPGSARRRHGAVVSGQRTGVLELAVLGLLHETPMHGYELRKRLNAFLGAFRAFGYGSLY